MPGQMAIATALDFTISEVRWPLFFFLLWWNTFFTNFLRLAKKWRKSFDYCAFCKKKIKLLLIRSFNFFCKMRHWILLLILALCLSVWQFLFRGNVGNSWHSLRNTETHFYKLWLKSFASVESVSIFFTIQDSRFSLFSFLPNMLISLQVFQRMARWPLESMRFIVEDTLYLWNEVGDSQFFCISDTRNS